MRRNERHRATWLHNGYNTTFPLSHLCDIGTMLKTITLLTLRSHYTKLHSIRSIKLEINLNPEADVLSRSIKYAVTPAF